MFARTALVHLDTCMTLKTYHTLYTVVEFACSIIVLAIVTTLRKIIVSSIF